MIREKTSNIISLEVSRQAENVKMQTTDGNGQKVTDILTRQEALKLSRWLEKAAKENP